MLLAHCRFVVDAGSASMTSSEPLGLPFPTRQPCSNGSWAYLALVGYAAVQAVAVVVAELRLGRQLATSDRRLPGYVCQRELGGCAPREREWDGGHPFRDGRLASASSELGAQISRSQQQANGSRLQVQRATCQLQKKEV